jgi:hypothetical protein
VASNSVPFEVWNLVRYLGFDDWDLGFAALGSVGVTDNVGKRRHAYLSGLKLQIPMPNSQKNLKFENPKKSNYSQIIEVKMSISSRARLGTLFH